MLLKVLFVEDAEDDALLEVRELRKGGFVPQFERVQTAEALQAAMGRQAWDVIIADYSLPEFSGPAALDLAQRLDPDVPVIIVSGKIDEETAVSCMRSGARDYVLKGNLQRLCAAVTRELQETKARREKRRLEEEVRKVHQRLELALQGSGTGVWDLDLATNALVLSAPWKAMLGFEADEVPQTFQELLNFIHPRDRDDYITAIEAQRSGAAQELALEHRLRRKDGTYRWFLCRGRIVEGGAANSLLVGAYIDVTERRRMEGHVRRLERMFSVGQLLGGMAHEIKNPLFIVTGHLQLLEDKLAAGIPASCEGELRIIQSTVKRLCQIVERFLSLAKPWKQQMQRCSVPSILRHTVDSLKEDMAQEMVTEFRMDPGLPDILCDPGHLTEVFLNLILNAVQAMGATPDQGKLTVSASLAAGAETAEEGQGHGWIEVRIRDNGPGIAQEHQHQLFEPFFSTKGPEDGSGLGLWTVRTLLLTMHGTIACESAVGRGTTFVVRLPFAKEPAQTEQPDPQTLSATEAS